MPRSLPVRTTSIPRRKARVGATALVLSTLLLTACGNKGPLYLPEQAPEREQDTESPSSEQVQSGEEQPA